MKHADTIEYLEAAIEMEVGILKLEEASRGIKTEVEKRKRARERQEYDLEKHQKAELENYTKKLDNDLKELEAEYARKLMDVGTQESIYAEKYEKKKRVKRRGKHGKRSRISFGGKGSGLIGTFFGTFIAAILIEMIIFGKRLTVEESLATRAVIIAAIIGVVCTAVVSIISFIDKKHNGGALGRQIAVMRDELNRLQNSVLLEKENREKKIALVVAKQEESYQKYALPKFNAMKKQEEFLLSQATETDLVLEKLYQQRNAFYGVGIVPPDYCYLDCVGVLHQIFKNDLADTMRDAVLIYEERVFRGDLIRGIDKINVRLDAINRNLAEMNVMMRFVCEKLCDISAQSGMMVAELGSIADKIDENTAVSEMILGGIALQNAQTEAVKNNTKALSKLSL